MICFLFFLELIMLLDLLGHFVFSEICNISFSIEKQYKDFTYSFKFQRSISFFDLSYRFELEFHILEFIFMINHLKNYK